MNKFCISSLAIILIATITCQAKPNDGVSIPPIIGERVLIVNTSDRLSSETLDSFKRLSILITHIPLDVTNCPAFNNPLSAVEMVMKWPNVKAAILVVDSDELPPQLIAPESLWGIINLSAWSPNGTDAETVEQRARKELWRTYALVMGAGNSAFPSCVLKPVSSVNDLDAIKGTKPGPEVLGKMAAMSKRLNFSSVLPILDKSLLPTNTTAVIGTKKQPPKAESKPAAPAK